MRNKGCVCVRAPMEEKHEAWTMRHSCNLPRGRTGRFLVSKFFFGLCSVEDRIVRFDFDLWIMNL